MQEKELNPELALLLEELEGYLTASLYEKVKRAFGVIPPPQEPQEPTQWLNADGLPIGIIIKEFEMLPSGVGSVFAGYCFKKETSQLIEKNFKVLGGGYQNKKWYSALDKMKEAGFGAGHHQYKSLNYSSKTHKKFFDHLIKEYEKFEQ